MSNTLSEISVVPRFRHFVEQLKRSSVNKTAFAVYSLGFILLFFGVVGGPLASADAQWFFLFLLLFFWIKVNRLILTHFSPPEELYLLIFLLSGLLEWSLLNHVHFGSSGLPRLSYPVLFFHQLNFLLMSWSFSLLLSAEGKNKASGFLAYLILFLMGFYLSFYTSSFNKQFLFLFLFLGLQKRTHWLERLGRIELAFYLIILFIFYANFHYPAYLDRALPAFERSHLSMLYALPFFLYYLGKIYLIVLMIRIPLVLVYNYAPLSRKLWIATLFQSTIPQFIQLVLLLFIFYLFIAGWQANNLREALHQLARAPQGEAVSALDIRRISDQDLFEKSHVTQIFTQNMGPVFLKQKTGEQEDFFLFFKPQSKRFHASDSLYLVKIDSAFLSYLFNHTHFIVGSGVAAYRYKPNSFMAYLYRLKFWQAEPFRINPIGIINPFMTRPNSKAIIWAHSRGLIPPETFFTFHNFKLIPIVVGRLFLPTGNKDEYFTFDIFYNARELYEWNFLTQILLILILLFFFLNSLVIRRMARFGKQINRTIVEKFGILRKGVRAIANGNLNYRVKIHGDDEFSEFADHFNQMSRELKRFMEEAREKERMDQELRIAHEVQLKMLPERLPEIPGFRIAADLTTANEVGGDFYDVFPLDARRFLIAIGDVSGKGMSAAFYMAQIISLLRYSTKFTTDLNDLVLRLNEYLMQHVLDSNIFVTAIIGILDITENNFTFIRAGHNPPFLLRAGQPVQLNEISSTGLGLGLTSSKTILLRNLEVKTITIRKGEKLVLFTDGLTEATKKSGENNKIIYGEERFKQQLLACGALPPIEFIRCLKEDILAFYDHAPQFDDQTILVIEKQN